MVNQIQSIFLLLKESQEVILEFKKLPFCLSDPAFLGKKNFHSRVSTMKGVWNTEKSAYWNSCILIYIHRERKRGKIYLLGFRDIKNWALFCAIMLQGAACSSGESGDKSPIFLNAHNIPWLIFSTENTISFFSFSLTVFFNSR